MTRTPPAEASDTRAAGRPPALSGGPLRLALVAALVVVVGLVAAWRIWSTGSGPGGVAATDGDPPVIEAVSAQALPDGTALVRWATRAPSAGAVEWGEAPSRLDLVAPVSDEDTRHEVVLTGLDPNATYHLRIRATNREGGETLQPAADAPPIRLETSDVGVVDTTVVDFLMGDARDLTASGFIDGALELRASLHEDFREAKDLRDLARSASGRAEAFGGELLVDDAELVDDRVLRAPLRGVSSRVLFTTDGGQFIGVQDVDGDGSRAVVRSEGGELHATTVTGGTREDTRLELVTGVPRDVVVRWTGDGAEYSLDGRVAARHALPAPDAVVFVAGDEDRGAPLEVHRVTGGPHAREGVFTSRILDAQAMVTWRRAVWDADQPEGTDVVVEVRTGSRLDPDDSWTPWRTLRGVGDTIGGSSRFLQYRVTLRSDDATVTPTVRSLGFTHDGPPPAEVEGEAGPPGP